MVNISTYLTDLGLSGDEAKVYIALTEHGPLTPLELSRKTQLNRTRIYRLLESIQKRRLTEEIVDEHTTRAIATSPDRLAEVLRAKQERIASLTNHFDEIKSTLLGYANAQQHDTEVKYFRGSAGIKQMIWNVLKAKNHIVGYTYRDLNELTGVKFARDFYEEFIRRNLYMRDIYSDTYKQSLPQASEILESIPGWNDHCTSRYIAESILPIPHQMDIYDDTVSIYNWHEGEVFGVEIHNEKVATFQRSLFEIIWKK